MTDLNLITVAELALYAPDLDTSRYDATTISGLISGGSKMATDFLQFTPLAEDIANELKEAKITTDGDLLIFPAKIPIISISSLSISKGSTDISVTLTNSAGDPKYNIDYNRRHVRFPYGEITLSGVPIFTDFYALKSTQFYTKMSYRGGFEVSALPMPIKQAVVLYMREQITRSFNSSGATRISQGGISLEFAQKEGKSDLVRDAERLLAPYRRIG